MTSSGRSSAGPLGEEERPGRDRISSLVDEKLRRGIGSLGWESIVSTTHEMPDKYKYFLYEWPFLII